MLCPAVGLEHSKKVRELLYRRVLRAWRHNTKIDTSLTYDYLEIHHGSLTFATFRVHYRNLRIIAAKVWVDQIPINTQWGGMYASETIDTAFAFPEAFATVPIVFANYFPSSYNALTMITVPPTKYNAPKVQLTRGTAGTASGIICILAIGDVLN